MSQGHRLLCGFGLVLLTFTACAHQGELTAADRTAIRAVIAGHIEAFRGDDAAGAFASPDLQARYGTPENCLTVVQSFYQPVYRPWRTGGFTNLDVIDGQLTQPAVLVGPHGDVVVALYSMQKLPQGEWRILGCALIP